jgi:hypothetical protein
MPSFSPEIVAVMRTVLEDAMSRLPANVSNVTAVKVLVAESILKAASQGRTGYNELFATATDQIQAIASMLS